MNLLEKLQSQTLAALEANNRRFISILSDYGFKVTFGNIKNTDFLRKAIQLLIKSTVPIAEVWLDRNELEGLMPENRGAIFDVSCKDVEGNVFIVEMQLTNIKSFIHRAKFYAFHRYNQMFPKGRFKTEQIRKIYVISFLGGKAYPKKEFHHLCNLKNQHGDLIDDQITHIVFELGKWNKKENELITDLDKLIYTMKYTDVATAQNKPPKFFKETDWIEKAIEELEIRNLTSEQRFQYEKSLAQTMAVLEEIEEHKLTASKAKAVAKKAKIRAKAAEANAKTAEANAKEEKEKSKALATILKEEKLKAEKFAKQNIELEKKSVLAMLHSGAFDAKQIAKMLSIPLKRVIEIQDSIKK